MTYKLNRELHQQLRSVKTVSNTDIRAFFTSMSQNIMTPTLNSVGSRKGGKFIYEITEGTDMQDKPIHALSVYRWNIDDSEYERVDSSWAENVVGVHYSSKSVKEAVSKLSGY